MAVRTGKAALAVAVLAFLPVAMTGCGFGDDSTAEPARTPAEDVAAKSRERVQAYLDAMVAKDVAGGRNQLCAPLQDAFDAHATGPNGDFADHFRVTEAAVTDVQPGPRGQEVTTTLTVAAGKRTAVRALDFTVTRSGTDWCISGEAPGTPAPTASPAGPGASGAPEPPRPGGVTPPSGDPDLPAADPTAPGGDAG
ncbi:hypothetical protein [Micromonospora fluostatini]|uniref:hypothetical protein n=1 Tax=Micromonospora sp. JCM 30529 TaxID=3421643 RepID=UPI003D178B6C